MVSADHPAQDRRAVGFEARPLAASLGRGRAPRGLHRPGRGDRADHRLDLAILDRATADLARWLGERPALRLSVNLSGLHLDHERWVDKVHAIVNRHGVPAANLDVELTESARPRDLALGERQIGRLRELGYAVWFDDFGTGWSRLAHVVQVPVDDRFFTARLGGRGDAVVRALLRLAEELGLATTIEGVERPDQAAQARLGCSSRRDTCGRPHVAGRGRRAARLGSGRPVLNAPRAGRRSDR